MDKMLHLSKHPVVSKPILQRGAQKQVRCFTISCCLFAQMHQLLHYAMEHCRKDYETICLTSCKGLSFQQPSRFVYVETTFANFKQKFE